MHTSELAFIDAKARMNAGTGLTARGLHDMVPFPGLMTTTLRNPACQKQELRESTISSTLGNETKTRERTGLFHLSDRHCHRRIRSPGKSATKAQCHSIRKPSIMLIACQACSIENSQVRRGSTADAS